MTRLDGKHAFVSGGGTGIGASVALMLAGAGARVTICGRRAEPLEEIAAQAAKISCVTTDVTSSDDVHRAVSEAVAGSGDIDIAIANAGAATSKPFSKMSAQDFSEALGVNLTGVFNLWQAALPSMQARGWGRLIAIASTAGLKGYPYVSGYCAAKHGVIGLTRALAKECASSGVTVNALCPGFTETPMLERSIENIIEKTGRSRDQAIAALTRDNPQGRLIQPAEVSAMALWLCSEEAGSVNGQALAICGGET